MNLFELFVKIGVDDQASSKLGSIAGKLGNGLKTAAKIGTAAVATAAAGITALTTAAVKNYAEYEQLVGGVDTLFKNASKKVQQYAAEAYRTSGMSANAYMANATAFSASLISSLGGDTEKAAEYANRAMVSMSDNANKMGTSLDSIVQTYQSLSRGNMAMLDNLKLGYGGTKAELERLIADAASYTDIQKEMGITVDASSMSFDNIVNAIAVVQGHLGIAGATAAEASTTIEGSVNSMKAAWSNMITGIADENANFETLIDQFVESVGTVGDNILPRITTAIEGVGKLIAKLAPKIASELPTIIESTLPSLLEGIKGVIKSVTKALPEIIKTALPAVLDGVVELIGLLLEELPTIIESILEVLPSIIEQLVDAIVELTPKLTEAVVQIVQSIADNLPTIIQSIVDAIPKITDSVNQAIVDNFPALLQAVIQIVLTLVKNLPTIIKTLVDQIDDIVATIVQVIVENAPAFIAGIVQIVWEIIKSLPSILGSLAESVWNIFAGIGTGIANAWPKFKEGLASIWENIKNWFSGLWDSFLEIGGNIIDGIKKGIQKAWKNLKEWFSGLFDDLIGIAKKILGIKSPSKVFKVIGQYVDEGLQEGLEDGAADVYRTVENISDGVIGAFGDDYDYGITTSSTSIGDYGNGSSAYGYRSSQNVNVTVGIDDSGSAMGLARALLPLLKIAEKEAYA